MSDRLSPATSDPVPEYNPFLCSKDNPCPQSWCCSKDGLCSNSADACDRDNGCLRDCKTIPDPHQCQSFKSQMFPNMYKTHTRPMNITPRPVPVIDTNSGTIFNCSGLPQSDYALQPCDLVQIMGGPDDCKYCLYYYDHIREALETYDMVPLAQSSCDASERKGAFRMAAFLAQIRHETKNLSTMFQTVDNGAGAIRMIPPQFQAIYQGIPRFHKTIDSILPGLNWTQVPLSASLQRNVGLLLSNIEHTFLTAGWWFVEGSSVRYKTICKDLRASSDQGRGNSTSDADTTGFHQVSKCIYGSILIDPGFKQRLQYYDNAVGVTSQFMALPDTTTNTTDSDTTPIKEGNDGDSNTIKISGPFAFVLGFIAVFLVLMLVYMIYNRRKRRGRNGIKLSAPDDEIQAAFASGHRERILQVTRPPLSHESIANRGSVYIYEEVNTEQDRDAITTIKRMSGNSNSYNDVRPASMANSVPGSIMVMNGYHPTMTIDPMLANSSPNATLINHYVPSTVGSTLALGDANGPNHSADSLVSSRLRTSYISTPAPLSPVMYGDMSTAPLVISPGVVHTSGVPFNPRPVGLTSCHINAPPAVEWVDTKSSRSSLRCPAESDSVTIQVNNDDRRLQIQPNVKTDI